MSPTDPESISAADQTKLIAVYERLCPDDIVALDAPRRPVIAAEMMDTGSASTLFETSTNPSRFMQPERPISCGRRLYMSRGQRLRRNRQIQT